MNDLEKNVINDIRCHQKNGVSLNPYSTVSARLSWDNGFAGKTKSITDYETPYRRGKLASELINSSKGTE